MSDTQTQERTKTDQAKDAASDVANQAGAKAGEVAGQAKEKASELSSTAAQKAGDVVGTARDELRQRASTEAENFGSRLHDVAEELRSMSQASSESGGMTSGLVGDLAERIDRGAQKLSDGDVQQVVDDVKRYARNNPGVFLLGAAGAGFLVGRLLRSVDLNEVKDSVMPSNGQDQQSLGNGHGASALPPSPATAPPTSLGSATPSPVPDATAVPTPNPGSTPTPGQTGSTPAAPGAPS
jgi:hypothetical protein